jgi:hypothetical protein
MLQLIKLESGCEVVNQSHKNKLDMKSFNNFRRMAQRERVGQTPLQGREPEAIDDFYAMGMIKLQKEFKTSGLDRFRPYSKGIMSMLDQDQSQSTGRIIPTELKHQDISDTSSSPDIADL